MNLYFDTEFTNLHQKTTLISIGIVADDDRTFYAELNDYDIKQVTPWIKDNVIRHLILQSHVNVANGETGYYRATKADFAHDGDPLHKAYNVRMVGTHDEVANELKLWLRQFDKAEIWSDCLAYDWVLFCEMFGGGRNVPENVLYIPFDICTLFKMKNVDPDISRERFIRNSVKGTKHNSLYDAYVIRECYRKLMTIEK